MIQNYDHCLRFQVLDKVISFIDDEAAVVVADNRGNICVHIEFDDQWEGVGKIVRFVCNGSWKDVPLDVDGDCYCPSEVVKKGRFSLGVYGGDLKTTTPVVVTVQASILSESGEELPDDPTPGIYDQIISQYTLTVQAADEATKAAWAASTAADEAIKALNEVTSEMRDGDYVNVEGLRELRNEVAVMDSRVDEVIALEPDLNMTGYFINEPMGDAVMASYQVEAYTNGFLGYVELKFKCSALATGAYWRCQLDAKLNPIASTELIFSKGDNENFTAIIKSTTDGALIEVKNISIAALDPTKELKAFAYYALEKVSIGALYQSEVADIRVGFDGTRYNSAGDAVRGQISKLIYSGGGGGGGGVIVDDVLTPESTNPVQSKAIYSMISNLALGIQKQLAPVVDADDNGKILCVVDGKWVDALVEESPIAAYIGNYIASALEGEY